jgi:hypothetical protein
MPVIFNVQNFEAIEPSTVILSVSSTFQFNYTSFFSTSISQMTMRTSYEDHQLDIKTVTSEDTLFNLNRNSPVLYKFDVKFQNDTVDQNVTSEIIDYFQRNELVSLDFYGNCIGRYLFILPYQFNFKFTRKMKQIFIS